MWNRPKTQGPSTFGQVTSLLQHSESLIQTLSLACDPALEEGSLLLLDFRGPQCL